MKGQDSCHVMGRTAVKKFRHPIMVCTAHFNIDSHVASIQMLAPSQDPTDKQTNKRLLSRWGRQKPYL